MQVAVYAEHDVYDLDTRVWSISHTYLQQLLDVVEHHDRLGEDEHSATQHLAWLGGRAEAHRQVHIVNITSTVGWAGGSESSSRRRTFRRRRRRSSTTNLPLHWIRSFIRAAWLVVDDSTSWLRSRKGWLHSCRVEEGGRREGVTSVSTRRQGYQTKLEGDGASLSGSSAWARVCVVR